MFESNSQGPEMRALERMSRLYRAQKEEYLRLCQTYNLPPQDLKLTLINDCDIKGRDRTRLFRLVISLMDMEKILGPDKIGDFMFPVDESHYMNSEIFQFCGQ